MKSSLCVFKFGGTSMGNTERIDHVAGICLREKPSVVVVSAMAGETNRLIGLASQLSPHTQYPEYDLLVSSGENVSVALLSMALRKRGIKPYPMTGQQAGITTAGYFSRAQISHIRREILLEKISQGYLPVVAGFQGANAQGQITTLGRGGSDTSAVAIAAGIGAEKCVIYTDVDGVYTTDPRICPRARIIPKIHTDEMMELASLGSKVLHIRSVLLAAKWNINLWVKNTFSENEGTQMLSHSLESEVVTGITSSADTVLFQIESHYSLSTLFKVLGEYKINTDIISQHDIAGGARCISFTTGEAQAGEVRGLLKKLIVGQNPLATQGEKLEPQPKDSEFIPSYSFNSNVGKVSIVGIGMGTEGGVASRMFNALEQENIPVLLISTSEIKLTCLVPRGDLQKAVNCLHREFLE